MCEGGPGSSSSTETGISVPLLMNHARPRPRSGMPLLLFFLLVTLGLSLWLGFQAVAAASSHRRTAEGVLRDYAEIAVMEYSRGVEDRLDDFLGDVFRNVPRWVRRDPLPRAEVVQRRLESALRSAGCRCEALRAEAVFLVVDLVTGTVESIPTSTPLSLRDRAIEAVHGTWLANPGERIALRTAAPGEVLDSASVLFFNASLDETGEEGRGRAIYVILVEMSTAEELFSNWYRDERLLPEAVVGSQPNDSLLYMAVRSLDGHPLFMSPGVDPEMALTRDTLPLGFGRLVVEAAVRPDAASALVIGGLPRARLPLLLALMLMTVGVGVAAFLQVRKEEELGRLRDDFISGVSHEFRTPLTQIRMFTELLADKKLRTEEERDRSTAVINREARRLTHLVENILHFSRMGRVPALPGTAETVVVREAVFDLLEAFSPLTQASGATLETLVDPPDLTISVSRGGLHRMLANLLDNALKYGPAGQTIRLEALVQGGRIRISVEDEGPGIPSRERARIWDPYHRLERDIEGQVRGSGIGLAVVAELAQAAGGSASVEGGADGGARFVIDFPDNAAKPPGLTVAVDAEEGS
jgi:signal transduction histidine kinase